MGGERGGGVGEHSDSEDCMWTGILLHTIYMYIYRNYIDLYLKNPGSLLLYPGRSYRFLICASFFVCFNCIFFLFLRLQYL